MLKSFLIELTINGQLYGLLPYLNRAQVKKMTQGIPVPAESLYDLAQGETLSMCMNIIYSSLLPLFSSFLHLNLFFFLF